MKDESNTSIYQEIMTKRELFKRKRKQMREKRKQKIERKCVDGGMHDYASYSNRVEMSTAICL